MRQRLETIFWFLLENGPAILTIGSVVIVIAVAQTTDLKTDILLQWILGILGLLATAELVERLRKIRHIEELASKTLDAVQNKFGERQSADLFFVKRLPPLGPYLEKAMDIRLTGLVLQRTLRENNDVLARRLREGAYIKILIVNPEGVAARRIPNFSQDEFKLNTQMTLQHIKWLVSLPESNGKIELRYMDEQPHFNILAMDADKDYGVMFIEFYAQRWVSDGISPAGPYSIARSHSQAPTHDMAIEASTQQARRGAGQQKTKHLPRLARGRPRGIP